VTENVLVNGESLAVTRAADQETLPLETRDDARGRKIRLFSRVGLWSVVVGMAPVVADLFFPAWSRGIPAGSLLPDLGLFVGGIGIALASGLILRGLGKNAGALKLAATAGVPLGATLAVLGTALLTEPWFPPTSLMQTLFSYGGRAALLLGVLMFVLLIVAFVTAGWSSEEEVEAIPGP
jgi:hypothetical protein